jgi:hypothetical protein
MTAALAWYRRARGVRHEPVQFTKVPTLYIWGDCTTRWDAQPPKERASSSQPLTDLRCWQALDTTLPIRSRADQCHALEHLGRQTA